MFLRIRLTSEENQGPKVWFSWAAPLINWVVPFLVSTRVDPFRICLLTTSNHNWNETGGFGSYLFGMSSTIAKSSTESNAAENIKDPNLSWIIGFLFTVSFLGLFSVLPLRKVHPQKSNQESICFICFLYCIHNLLI